MAVQGSPNDARISVGFSAAERQFVEDLVGRRQMPRALQAAVSRTVTTGTARIARRIGEHVRLRIGDIKKQIHAKRGSFDNPEGSIMLSRQGRVWLSQFLTSAQHRAGLARAGGGRRRPPGGVTVRVRKIATPQHPTAETLPHAFTAVTPNATPMGIFERTGVKRVMFSGRHKGQVREVIRRLQGPTALGVFVNARGEAGARTVFDETLSDLGEVLEKNMLSQIDRFWRRNS